MPNVNFNTKALTTNTGAPIISNEFSLKAGNRGEEFLASSAQCVGQRLLNFAKTAIMVACCRCTTQICH